MQLDKYTIFEHQLIEQAIEVIEFNNSRCAIVVNSQKKVIGIISEGDILRLILKGISVKSPVKSVMNPSFKFLFENEDRIKIFYFFKKGITLIPVLNQKNELIEVLNVLDYIHN